jgi:hypothetical protein
VAGRQVSRDTARIPGPRPECDVCSIDHHRVRPALYDGKTVHGPWAYMCQECFDLIGFGRGPLGQLLIVADEQPNKEGTT